MAARNKVRERLQRGFMFEKGERVSGGLEAKQKQKGTAIERNKKKKSIRERLHMKKFGGKSKNRGQTKNS